MIGGFLKSFLTGEKNVEEQALLAKQQKHDVMTLDVADDEEVDEEQPCAPKTKGKGGCGGCGCG